jgi:hypothetical protein
MRVITVSREYGAVGYEVARCTEQDRTHPRFMRYFFGAAANRPDQDEQDAERRLVQVPEGRSFRTPTNTLIKVRWR